MLPALYYRSLITNSKNTMASGNEPVPPSGAPYPPEQNPPQESTLGTAPAASAPYAQGNYVLK